MTELSKSFGRRESGEGSAGKISVKAHSPMDNADRTGITLSFDVGHPGYREPIEAVIDADDFLPLMRQMLWWNREAFIEALSGLMVDDPP